MIFALARETAYHARFISLQDLEKPPPVAQEPSSASKHGVAPIRQLGIVSPAISAVATNVALARLRSTMSDHRQVLWIMAAAALLFLLAFAGLALLVSGTAAP
jgi:hypothetical protein